MTKKFFLLASAVAALSLVLANAPALAGDTVGLITKTNTNPFFVKMKQGFEAKAKELGLTPQAYAGSVASKPSASGLRTVLNFQRVGTQRYFDAAGFPGRTLGLDADGKQTTAGK